VANAYLSASKTTPSSEEGVPIRMTRRVLAACLAAALAVAVSPAWSGGAKQVQPRRNDYTAYLLDHLKIWPREVGRRVMADDTPIPASLIARKQRERAAAAAADPCESSDKPVGCRKSFTVWFPKTGAYESVPFVLGAKGPHSYVWVMEATYDPTDATAATRTGIVGGIVSKSQAEEAAERYEKVYEIDRAYFGHEPNPLEKPYRTPPRLPENWRDADGDVHVNIVNYPIDAGASYVAGYYSSSDEYPREISPNSNEGEFFFMNSLMMDVGGDEYTGVLAHEFYHMIQFANDSNEETWINEGMADIAIEVNGFDVLGHLNEFFDTPEGDQLNHWGGAVLDYGTAYAFLTYLFEHYGGPDDPTTEFKENYTIGKEITQVAQDGFDGVEVVLKANPRKPLIAPYYRSRTVDDVYLDWTIANYLDDTTIDAGQYGYYTQNLTVAPMSSTSEYPSSESDAITPYTNRYYEFISAGDGTGSLLADREVPIVNNRQGLPSGTHEYWGNRGDEMTTTMTRAADLRGASAPTLTFWYWYDIETDWDYAYLEVSTDAGETWTPVACCESRGTDPNGNNEATTEAAGITGLSGVDDVMETLQTAATTVASETGGEIYLVEPTWVEESVDLSEFKGKEALIRFRYQTDAAVTNPGFTVDDVALADGAREIWPLDTAESADVPWQLEGNTALSFARITPLIPNRLVPQVIKFGARTLVSRPGARASGAKASGSDSMDALTSVLVVSSLSRVSSESFDYGVKAKASPQGNIAAPVLEEAADEIKLPYTLEWKPASNAGKLSPKEYVVEETQLLADVFFDDAENGLSNWQTSSSGTPAQWQQSGDTSHSGSSSFFARAIKGVATQEMILASKEKLAVPLQGATELRFWSYIHAEFNSAGFVEASPDGETWTTLTSVHHDGLVTDGVAEIIAGRQMTEHVASLDPFRGREVFIRFRYFDDELCCVDQVPFGWYVDDIAIRTVQRSEIGRTPQTAFTLTARPNGTNTYRVVARYTENLQGPWSSPLTARVSGGIVSGGAPARPPRGLAATGVGGASWLGWALVLGAAAFAVRLRRRVT
jgi:hypothetical protein